MREDQLTALRAKAYRVCGQCRTPEQAVIALRWLDRAIAADRLIAAYEGFYVDLCLKSLPNSGRHKALCEWRWSSGKRR